MFIDVVIPKGNEKEFLAMAKRLGIGGLCFLYKGKQKKSEGFSGSFRKSEGLLVASINAVSVTFDAEIPAQLPIKGFAGISLSSIMGRKMRHAARNIRLFREGKLPVIAASLATRPYELRSVHDFSSLLVCLGMTPGEAKKALGVLAPLLSGRNI